jgi:hypothetical protein
VNTAAARAIPFTVDAIHKIAPERVLDLDGSARWPGLLRAHVRRPKQQFVIEALVASPLPENRAITYDHVSVGPVAELLTDIDGRFDVALIGAAMDGLDQTRAKALFRKLLNKSRYVIIDVPLGLGDHAQRTPKNGAVWTLKDFSYLPAVRRSLYNDSTGRLRATIIASNADPKKLRNGFAAVGADYYDEAPTNGAGDLERVLDRVAQQTFELEFIKNYSTYRLGRRLINTKAWNAARWLRNQNRAVVTVTALGEKNELSQGTHVHVRHASVDIGKRCIPWDFAERTGEWQELPIGGNPDRTFIWAERGRVRLPLGADPEIRLAMHNCAGKVEVAFGKHTEVIDLYSPELREISVLPAHDPMVRPAGLSENEHRGKLAPDPALRVDMPKSGSFTELQTEFIERMKGADTDVCAVHTPRWLGISASTRELFEHCYPIPNTRDQEPYRYDDKVLRHHADVLAEAGVKHVVFSGGDRSHLQLAEILRKRDPSFTIDMLWHGSYTQFLEDYNWEMFTSWIDAAKAGTVRSIGTVKAGQERLIRAAGVPSSLVLNLITGEGMAPPQLEGDEKHVGMWISGTSFRKIPHPMLSAIAMTPGTRLHAAGLEKRAIDVIDYFKISTAEVHQRTLPKDELLEAIRRTHLTLYVTFSECCPMVPLESLQLGVPCLTGPNSHLFEDHDYLFERLVVPFPDRADTIADYMARAIDERDQIVNAYREYIPGYNERARQSVRDFIAGHHQ